MMLMIVGLVIFLGIHLLPTSPEIRSGLINRFGPGMYRAIFSLISLAGFAVIVLGYHKMQLHPGKNPVLWDPPMFLRHITLALMLPAIMPGIFTSWKITLSLAIRVVTIAELVGAVTGIGHKLSAAQELFSVAEVFAWTLVLVALLFMLESLVVRVETYVLRWRA